MQNLLILSDLDGTLLDPLQRISPENAAAIRRFKKSGGRFTLATGRMEQSVAPFIRELEIDIPVILYNGAKIVHPVTGIVLYEKQLTIEPELWARLYAELSGEVAMLVYKNGEVYTPQRTGMIDAYERKDRIGCLPLDPLSLDEPLTKLLFIGSDPGKLQPVERIIVDSGLRCGLVYSESNYLEVLPDRVSKGAALQELRRLMQVEGLYAIAVGDNLNDLSMLQLADRGYAVENAHPELKAAAHALTVHHERHAIASIIGGILDARSELA